MLYHLTTIKLLFKLEYTNYFWPENKTVECTNNLKSGFADC